MEIVIKVLVGLIAAIHSYIMWFEMFAWDTKGKNIFTRFPNDLFAKTKEMAANQGLYNGFLAAGLVWSFFIQNADWNMYVSLFFLGCVAIAGIYGAFTVAKKIFFVQALPALVTIVLLLINFCY
jgi:putative membrane protein